MQRIEISYKTIVFAVFFLLGLYFLFLIKNILVLLFISFIITSALRPAVEALERRRVRRGLSIAIIYFVGIALLVLIGIAIVPPLVIETTRLINTLSPKGVLPSFYKEILVYLKNLDINNFSRLSPYGGNVLDIIKFIVSIFGGFVWLVTLLVFTFYLLLERKHLTAFLEMGLPSKKAEYIVKIIVAIENRLGTWVRGQVFLCVIIGIMTFVGLTVLNVNYALPLAILAGLLEIIPNIGPIVSAVPAIIVALFISPGMALITTILFIIIQQLENILVVPTVMKRVVGLNPTITILSLLIGGELMGIGGAVLSVPIVLVLQTMLMEYLKRDKPNF